MRALGRTNGDGARSLVRPDGSSATAPAWDAIVDELRSALDERRPEVEIRTLIRAWCTEARQTQLTPEQFLVTLKNQFVHIPALQGIDDGSLRNSLRDSLITMCIEEYFKPNG